MSIVRSGRPSHPPDQHLSGVFDFVVAVENIDMALDELIRVAPAEVSEVVGRTSGLKCGRRTSLTRAGPPARRSQPPARQYEDFAEARRGWVDRAVADVSIVA